MEIELTKTAAKQLDLLDEKTRQRVYKKLYDLRDKRPEVTLDFSKGKPGTNGRYYSLTNGIEVFKNGRHTNELKETIAHEYGHAVSDRSNDKIGVGLYENIFSSLVVTSSVMPVILKRLFRKSYT